MICRTPMSGNRTPLMFGMGTHQTMEPTNETHAFCGKYSKRPSPTRPFPCSEDGDAADEAELQDRALPDLPRRVAGVSHILLALLCRMRLALLWALLWALLRARLWALLWALLWARLWALLCALGVALCISGRTCRHVEALPFLPPELVAPGTRRPSFLCSTRGGPQNDNKGTPTKHVPVFLMPRVTAPFPANSTRQGAYASRGEGLGEKRRRRMGGCQSVEMGPLVFSYWF